MSETRFQPIDLGGMMDRLLSPRARASAIAGIVRREIAETEWANHRALGRATTPHVITVNGRRGAPIEAVKVPGGNILVDFNVDLRVEVARWILETLRRTSPVLSGRYREAHALYLDGVETRVVPDMISAGAEIMISNPLPYHRRLEIGRTESGRPFVVQTEDRLYERTVRYVKARFGGAVTIAYTFRAVGGGTRGASASATRVPAIVITSRRS